jgi:glucose uptake protein
MVLIESYPVAVAMCVITMMCWGSWANTQKLASKEWKFQCFYWDYVIGVLLLTLILAFTMGSTGEAGRGFVADLKQASMNAIWLALLGGIIFNFANILLVAAIDIAGMAVAFPVGIGIALAQGVFVNHMANPEGNAVILFAGVALVGLAIIIDAVAYKKMQTGESKGIAKGLILSVVAGVSMGWFYRFVAASMVPKFTESGAFESAANAGLMTPYTALVIFAIGLFVSSFVFVPAIMLKPISGEPVGLLDYFKKGNLRLHVIGIVGGIIWSIGMSFSIIASGAAGPAISYGLGQGATMVAAFWGVFIWKEFKDAPKGTNKLIAAMFLCFFVGLALIIAARLA